MDVAKASLRKTYEQLITRVKRGDATALAKAVSICEEARQEALEVSAAVQALSEAPTDEERLSAFLAGHKARASWERYSSLARVLLLDSIGRDSAGGG